MKELRVRIKDNKKSPTGKFHRFLFPFSSKFSDLNFASYVLYNLPVLCHVSHTVSLVTYADIFVSCCRGRKLYIKSAVVMLPRFFGHKLSKKPIALLSKFVAAEFENATIKSPAISDLLIRKTRSGKSRDYLDVIVFEKLRFQNVLRSHENQTLAFSNSFGLKRVFGKSSVFVTD